MTNQLYVFYNTLSKRYGSAVAFPSDAFAAREVSNSLKDTPDKDFTELCRIGEVDIETGIATTYAPVRVDLVYESSAVPIDNIEKSM